MAPLSRTAALDIGALFLIWLGTLLLVLVAIPEATGALLLGSDGSILLSPVDGAALTARADYAPLWRYYACAGPAMSLITLGMGWQAWRCYQATPP